MCFMMAFPLTVAKVDTIQELPTLVALNLVLFIHTVSLQSVPRGLQRSIFKCLCGDNVTDNLLDQNNTMYDVGYEIRHKMVYRNI